jgi:type II secretory pathway predicted ATPase ExeA
MDAPAPLDRFGLRADPFPPVAGDACFLGGSRRPTWEALQHVIRHEPGIVAVIGEPGAGKTVLCRRLARALADRFVVLRIDARALRDAPPARAVGAALARRVRDPRPSRCEATLRARLAALHDAGRQVLLLVDDADRVPPETLDRLRLIAQRDLAGDAMRIVLLGTGALDAVLASPQAGALATRVTQVLRLRRLPEAELATYLEFRMRAAGRGPGRGDAFEPRAVRALSLLSRGVPGRVDALAARALRTASRRGRDLVRAGDVAAAALGAAGAALPTLHRRAGATGAAAAAVLAVGLASVGFALAG